MKRWFQSRTIWMHIASAILSLGPLLLDYLRALDLSASQLALWVLVINVATNVSGWHLRNITKTAIGKSEPEEFTGGNV